MSGQKFGAVVIGASAGAVEALSKLLPGFPQDYSLPIMVVVHLPSYKKSMMAEIMQTKCALKVKEAEDKEPIENGTVYFAPPDYHLQVENGKTFSLSSDEPIHYSRPSIDVLFETAADTYGDKLIGVILTGANSDGAAGLKAVIAAGGTGVVLDPKAAYASTMPRAALAACSQARVLQLEEIATFLHEAAAQ